MAAAAPATRTVVVQAPQPVAQPPARRRINTAKVKEAVDAAKAAATRARERAREAGKAAEEAIGEARRMDLVWAVGESAVAMGSTVGASALVGAADWYTDEAYDMYYDVGLIAVSMVGGIAALGAGLVVHPRIGTVGLAAATGVGAVGVSRAVQRGVGQLLDTYMSPAAPSMVAP